MPDIKPLYISFATLNWKQEDAIFYESRSACDATGDAMKENAGINIHQ